MRYAIVSQGSYPALEVTLGAGDRFIAEAGAMSWMTSGMHCQTSARGGLARGLRRSLLGRQSLFQNTFSVPSGEGTVALVPGKPGTIAEIALDGRTLFLEKGAYLGSTPDVELDTRFQGLKGLFNEGLFILKAGGRGTLFFSGYGDLDAVPVEGEYVVDNGFAVAWESTLEYSLTRSKKVRSFLFGDQLLLRFQGHGTVWVQSRSAAALANWVHPFRRVKSRS